MLIDYLSSNLQPHTIQLIFIHFPLQKIEDVSTLLFCFRMDPFSYNQEFSFRKIFKKSKNETSVENAIAVIGVKKALLIGKLR